MIRTLVVDDDFRVADLHRLYTEQLDGFEVVGLAHTGAEALLLAERQAPDLVLLDIYLPDMSGLDVLRAIRGGDRPVDVIAITAAQDVATIRSAMQHGSVHYLIKPFTFAVFREKLQSYAEVQARLGSVGQASQAEVDRLYGLLRTGIDEELPKGLSPATRDLVVSALRSAAEPVSASDVARIAGLSRVTARRYLEHLADGGSVEISMLYGTPGRPEHRYRLSAPRSA
ncbi:MAG TPA: response regulator [Candidatus Limnocylindrales bacterium]|jgi:two-component system CitB family response regulator|nr:response regulator [Candidatus Limnocylindrales bacterium]